MEKVRAVSEQIKDRIGRRRWKRLKVLLILVPFLIYIFVFSYIPLAGWLYSVFEYEAGSRWYQVEWVGLKFFKKILTDKYMLRGLKNTLVFSGISLLTSVLPPFFAILLNEIKNTKMQRIVQTITTFPNFISVVVVFGLAQTIFSASGLWNQLLKMVGLPTSMFGLIGDKDAVYWFQTALGIWKNTGWAAILYLAAISSIDGELYDAAKVDGANKMALIRHITLPGLATTYFVSFVLSIGNILNTGFEKYYLFWNSLVTEKIEVLDYYIYSVGIGSGDYSYATAASILKSIVSITLVLFANHLSKKIRGTTVI